MRKRKLNKINTDKSLIKFKSELARVLYYMSVGYNGPHPWGTSARPPYPEFNPAPIKDTDAEPEVVSKIEDFLADSKWDIIFKRFLRELNKEL